MLQLIQDATVHVQKLGKKYGVYFLYKHWMLAAEFTRSERQALDILRNVTGRFTMVAQERMGGHAVGTRVSAWTVLGMSGRIIMMIRDTDSRWLAVQLHSLAMPCEWGRYLDQEVIDG